MAESVPPPDREPAAHDWVSAPPRPRPLAASQLPAGAFRYSRRVRFGDCDPAGIVFTPRFVEMANEAMEEFFPGALGLDYYGLIQAEKVGLGYARIGYDFIKPGLLGDALAFTVQVGRIGGASAAFILHAHRGDEEILRATLVMVTTDLVAHRPIPLPSRLRAALVAYQDRCR